MTSSCYRNSCCCVSKILKGKQVWIGLTVDFYSNLSQLWIISTRFNVHNVQLENWNNASGVSLLFLYEPFHASAQTAVFIVDGSMWRCQFCCTYVDWFWIEITDLPNFLKIRVMRSFLMSVLRWIWSHGIFKGFSNPTVLRWMLILQCIVSIMLYGCNILKILNCMLLSICWCPHAGECWYHVQWPWVATLRCSML